MNHGRGVVISGILLSLIIGAAFYFIGGPHFFSGPFEVSADETIKMSRAAYERAENANQDLVAIWVDRQFLSWRWWVSLALQVLPWLVWAWVRPKASTHRLLYLGSVLVIISCYLDFMGATLGLWRYHMEIIPSIPSFFPWDFALYPVAGMLIFQHRPFVSKYVKAALFASIASFVCEPLFTWAEFYEPTNWSSFYSWPVHYVNYLIADWVGRRTDFQPLGGPPRWTPPGA